MNLARRCAAVLVGALVAGVLAVVPLAPAAAVQGTVPGSAAPMWQTNGVVRALATARGILYVGGDFTAVRPPGSAPGQNAVVRNRIAAFDAASGALITSFNPDMSGPVRALAVSPDGGTLYAGGDFTTVGGQPRMRLAAFSTAGGALTSWAPGADNRVGALAASASTVYAGGSFGLVNNSGRRRLVALTATTGAVRTTFTGTADNIVSGLALSPAQDRLYVAGAFLSLNGDAAYHAAGVLDASTGRTLPFAAGAVVPPLTPACKAEMKDVTVDAAGAYFASEGTGGGCFDGTFAASHSDGSLKWVSRCLGATQGIEVLDGVLYAGSHAHDCADDSSFDPDAFAEIGWALGLSRKLTARSTTTGALASWYPNTNGGTGEGLGPRVLATDGRQLFVGGEFTTVNGVAQQGITRFSPSVSTAVPARPANPRAVARDDGSVAVFVRAPLDLDDVDLVVRLYRDGGTTPIAQAPVHSLFWRQPVVAFADTGLPAGSTHTYSVDVAQANGTGVSARATSTPVTVVAASAGYERAVSADDPSLYWRLGEPSGPVVADSAGLDGGTASGGLTFAQPGAVGDADRSLTTNGTNGYISSERPSPSLPSFTVEAWVRTTSTTGGRVVGFGNRRGGLDFSGNPVNSSAYDKHLYMTDDGRLVFGVYANGVSALTTPSAYNDGQWHHVVGTQGPSGMALYVDGVRQGRNGQTANQSYEGFWRVGGDSLGGWPGQPSSSYFAGQIDEVAVYPRALSAAAVVGHYNASGRTAAVPPAPTDAYGAAVSADGPSSFWRLDEAAGTSAADSSGNGNTGAFEPQLSLGVPGALPAGSAVTLDGASGNVRSVDATAAATYSAELWFATRTQTGGKLVGFGDRATGASSSYDKHVYMTNDGRLVFGVYNDGFDLAASAGAYNDGQFHHLVATQGADGMRLYVDNTLVASNGRTTSQPYQGYWRVGGDNLNAWPDRPETDWFAGTIDEVAVYDRVLGADAVDRHYRASGRTGPDTVAPVVRLTDPQDGAVVPAGDATARVEATDGAGVTAVELLVDGVVVGSDTSAPYSVAWTAQEGTRQLTARAVDAAGNAATTAPVSVTVPAPDTVPPAPVTGLAATDVQRQQVSLSWAAATDDRGAVAGYQLERDGAPVGGTLPGTGFTDTGLTPATSYTYRVRAVDAAGNSGELSAPLTVTTATDAVVAQDTWAGADGTAWASPWVTGAAAGSVTTTAGRGVLAVTDTAGAFARAQLGATAQADSEVLLSYRFPDTTAQSYLGLYLRGSGGWANSYRPRNGYGLQLSSTSGRVELQRTVNGATTVLQGVAGGQAVTTARQLLRLQVAGSTIRFRTWAAGQPEPAAWTATVTDTAVVGAGQLHVSLNRASTNRGAKAVELDDLTLRQVAAP